MVREDVALLPEDARVTLLDASSVAALSLSSKTILNDLATSVILKNETMYVLSCFSQIISTYQNLKIRHVDSFKHFLKNSSQI